MNNSNHEKGKDPPESIPSKLDFLKKIFDAQQAVARYMFEAERAKNSGNLESAKSCYENQIEYGKLHLELALKHNNHYPPPIEIPPVVQIMVNAMMTLADVLQSMGNLKLANQYRNEVLVLSEAYLPAEARIEMMRSQAASLISQGRFNEALTTLTTCRDELLKFDNPVSVVRITIDMVDILNWLGDYSRAGEELEKASGLLKKITGNEAPTLENFTRILLNWSQDPAKNRDQAADPLRAIQVYRASNEVIFYGGLINKALHRYEEAVSNLRWVLPEYTKLGVGAAIEFHFAAIYEATGEHQKALETIGRIEPVITANSFMRSKLPSLLKLKAEVFHHLSMNTQALESLETAIHDLTAKYYDPDTLWKLYHVKGQILSKTNRENALKAYALSAEVINGLRKAPLGYRLDNTYLEDKFPVFREAIDLAADLHNGKACCTLMEMIKSRALTATLNIPAETFDQDSAANAKKAALYQTTSAIESIEYQAYRGEITPDEAINKLSALRNDRDRLLEEIRFSDPRWRNLTEPVAFDPDAVADILAEKNFCVLNLFYFNNRVNCVMIIDKQFIVSAVNQPDKVQRSLRTFLSNLDSTTNFPNELLFDPSDVSISLNATHFIRSDTLERAIMKKGIIVIPHGSLHLLPWAGLEFKGRRLFEYCPVAILPNLSCMVHLDTTFATHPGIAMIGPPEYRDMHYFARLTGAEREFEEISGIYPEERHLPYMVTGTQSTEKAFRDMINNTRSSGNILHMACHGVIDPDEPMHSGLILYDGRVDASEIALRSIPFDEVILSACSTGWRPQKVRDIILKGDDILGLPGAFIEAGSRAVLVSITPVDDYAGADFMVKYHTLRSSGETPMTALQHTQEYMLNQNKYFPFQWLGFTLYGCS